jgi:hypothetical protein
MCTSTKFPLTILCQAGCGKTLELHPKHVEALKRGDDILFVCCDCLSLQADLNLLFLLSPTPYVM